MDFGWFPTTLSTTLPFLKISKGSISGYQNHLLQTDAAISPGNSGGPGNPGLAGSAGDTSVSTTAVISVGVAVGIGVGKGVKFASNLKSVSTLEQAIISDRQKAINKIVFLILILITKNNFC